ncbi:hypothetical protein [Paenibacillus sp. YIM B09110]|uniref:hypothetical protein n=1 Tax=Paenibacillus sp. YIM B09110 TaxID=3126102 RepID=UPI00301CBFE4
MVEGWVTMLVLAFGLAVAIIGVIAYLRMFRKEKFASTAQSSAEIPPPVKISARTADTELAAEPISEQADRID